VDRGFYATQIERLWSVFPKEQILILKNENLRNDLQNSLDLVCDFLGVTSFEQKVESKTVHARPYVDQLDDREKAYLIEIFKPEIRKLEKMLHWDCNQWLKI
ncbi:MAG: sulfotransferase domain-containing protein, partial [Bacteroidetes bacterium]|nr:sulfotransferase domain-containing protein [Bacteroidota bacterium]